jgi:hypothetical protein
VGPMTSGAGAGAGAGGRGAGFAGGTSSGGSGGLTGAGVAGGVSPVPPAVAECEQYCETMSYRLPQALCEDWRTPEWEPPFCKVDTAQSCTDYCNEVYDGLTSECAALLRPVIRCVAPIYAAGVISPCWLAECRPELYSLTSACYGLEEKLAAARAAWQASGVVDYQLTYASSNDLNVRVVVRAGSQPTVAPVNATAWTVPQLFEEVERYLREPGLTPYVTYHADLGHVVDLSLMQGCAEASPLLYNAEVAPLR